MQGHKRETTDPDPYPFQPNLKLSYDLTPMTVTKKNNEVGHCCE